MEYEESPFNIYDRCTATCTRTCMYHVYTQILQHLLSTGRHQWWQFIVRLQPPPPSFPSPSPRGAFTSVVAMLRGAGVDDVISTNTFVSPHHHHHHHHNTTPHHNHHQPPSRPPSFLLSAPQLPACLLASAFAI